MKALNIFTLTVLAPILFQPLRTSADGNIEVSLEDGVLVVVGDHAANDIIITETLGYLFIGGSDFNYPVDYWFWKVPSNWRFLPPTTVNGGDSPIILDPSTASTVTDIVVLGGGGNEYVYIHGWQFGDTASKIDFWIDTGSGKDRIVFPTLGAAPNQITGDLTINTGLDDDEINMMTLSVGGNVDLSSGHGRDWIRFFGTTNIAGNARVNLGGMDDFLVAAGDNMVGGDLSVQMGQGDDAFFGTIGPEWLVQGSAVFNAGQGFDPMPSLANLFANPLEMIGFESP